MAKRYDIKTTGVLITDVENSSTAWTFTEEQWEFAQRFLKVAKRDMKIEGIKFLRVQFDIGLAQAKALFEAAAQVTA